MKFNKQAPFLTLLLVMGMIGCTSDNYDDYYADNCDTTNVTYSESVQPIMQNRCVSCHNANFPSGGVRLDNYEQVKKHADEGDLLGSIKHLPGYEPMPQGSKLDDCTILKIEIWIDNGALNN